MIGGEFDWMILEVFSNLGESMMRSTVETGFATAELKWREGVQLQLCTTVEQSSWTLGHYGPQHPPVVPSVPTDRGPSAAPQTQQASHGLG